MPFSRSSHVGEYFIRSGLVWATAGFSFLVVLNLVTLALGPTQLLAALDSHPWAPIASIFVFDSWGTAGGLLGVVILFTPLLFGVEPQRRVHLSVFFFAASVATGVTANVLWNSFYNDTGSIGSGSSSIDFAGQAIIFALSISGLISLFVSRRDIAADPYARAVRQFFTVVYVTLIASTVYLIAILQPIFTPTLLYNWRVHEFSFALGVAATFLYEASTLRPTTKLVPSPTPNEPK